jgi:hypothetical protein
LPRPFSSGRCCDEEAAKKNRLLAAVIVLNVILLVVKPQTDSGLAVHGQKSAELPVYAYARFYLHRPDGYLDQPGRHDKIMGDKSGARGALVALLLGVVTAVPLYALMPVAGVLLKKGSKIRNVLIFLCASASIRIPLLLFEISSLG